MLQRLLLFTVGSLVTTEAPTAAVSAPTLVPAAR